MFPQIALSQIKHTINLAMVVRRYVKLSRNLKAHCPFHDDHTPSFSINQRKQIWKCFGCGRGGDVIAFVQQIEKISFIDAVKILAAEAGIALPRSERFNRHLLRKWKKQQFRICKLNRARTMLKNAFLSRQDEICAMRRALPKKDNWDSWDANDYLAEQLVDARFDFLDERMEKHFNDLDQEEAKIRNE